MTQFSPGKYVTFEDWYKAQKRKQSPYVKRIVRSHSIYPKATLTQLRGHAKKKETPISKVQPEILYNARYESLPESIRSSRRKVLEIISKMRHGMSFSEACKEVGVSPKTTLKIGGRNFRKASSGRWVVSKKDTIPRWMQFWEKDNPELKTINVRDSNEASKIGLYMNGVRDFINRGAEKKLSNFSRKRGYKGVYDKDGIFYYFEYDLDKLEQNTEEQGFEPIEVYDYGLSGGVM